MKLQVEMSDEQINEVNNCFRNKKPIVWKKKKYMIQSGGEIRYDGKTKTWHTDLILIPVQQKMVNVNHG